jgi:hypothetical protein
MRCVQPRGRGTGRLVVVLQQGLFAEASRRPAHVLQALDPGKSEVAKVEFSLVLSWLVLCAECLKVKCLEQGQVVAPQESVNRLDVLQLASVMWHTTHQCPENRRSAATVSEDGKERRNGIRDALGVDCLLESSSLEQ